MSNEQLPPEQQDAKRDTKSSAATSSAQTAPLTTPTLEQTITAVAPSLITSVMESVKKVGMPATVAAIVSVLVTVTPFLFKIDERYAKATELQEAIDQNKEDLAKLTAEVGKVAGAVDVLSQIVGKQYDAIQQMRSPQNARISPAPIVEPEDYQYYEDATETTTDEDVPHASATEEYVEEEPVSDSEQDIAESLNILRKSLDESRKNIHEIQERQE